MSTVEAGVGVD